MKVTAFINRCNRVSSEEFQPLTRFDIIKITLSPAILIIGFLLSPDRKRRTFDRQG